ncbi:MAG: lipocalin family protein [Bacteroidota bacterium]
MKKQFAVLALGFILIFSSCSKDNTPPKTKTQLLTQGSWKFKSATTGGTDFSSSLQACQKDNILIFVAAGGTGTVDEGPTKCNAGDPQTTPFTWNFQSNETILFISTVLFTGGNSNFTLVSLSETELVVSQDVTIGPTRNVVVTFMH